DTICDRCAGPRQFGEYQIKTWNEEYHPNISMSDALAKSDNIAMIFVAEKLGPQRLRNYFRDFGIGEPTDIELQDDTGTPFPNSLRPVELATVSFGQGISTNSMQLVRAVSVIANQGILMKPKILSAMYDPITGNNISVEPKELRRVVSAQTAQQVTQMMIYSAQHGEAQWTYRPNHTVAGKTGTSQVAVKGGYDEEQTIASFVGFAPANNPAFVMLVKLTAPTSSIWAAETAAPLWYDIAEELYLLLQIPPDRQ
ncbi:MAG TPA: penicillin-binding transpeptidase domain-containing protein, partial [Candidatus Woesebacteria bacterium]|nr:penicillin-binding transpeptidase domain-containing protein [Candidatus Woesebacteria bacterium]